MKVLNILKNFVAPTTLATEVKKENRAVGQSIPRERYGLEDWRLALKQAEDQYSPSRELMQTMYNQFIIDDVVAPIIEKRVNLTLSKKYTFKNTPENSKFFNSQWVDMINREILNSVFFGYSLVFCEEFTKESGLTKFENIRRAFYDPEKKELHKYLSQINNGLKIDSEANEPYFFEFRTQSIDHNTKCGIGLLYLLGISVIFGKKAKSSNMSFVDKMLLPFFWAKTSKTEDENKRLHASLVAMQESPVLVTDFQDDISIIESKNVGNGSQAFDTFQNRIERRMNRLILGHADAMDSISGKLGSSDEIKQALDIITLFDSKKIAETWNFYILPKLVRLGLIPNGIEFEFEPEPKTVENKTAYADLLIKLQSLGFGLELEEARKLFEMPLEEVATPKPAVL